MRVLVTANPMHGHVNTVLPLALAARRAGHEVVLATGPDLAGHAERHGVPTWPVGPTHAESGGQAGLSVDYFTYAAEKRAVELVPRAQGWRPDLVVHEDTELAGPIAAATTGARSVVHGLGLMYPVRIFDALAATVDRLGDRWGAPAVSAALRGSVYLELAPPALRLPGERIWRRARPLRPRPGSPAAGEELPAAVAALPHRRTVHLTLGTVFHDSDVLATALEGLRTLPVDVVVTVGPGVDGARLGPQPPHVLVAPYLPHALLLPRCDLVVSQGGAGIVFGALAHGLPQLVLPQGGDQFLNAEACRDSGAALTLAPGEVTAAAVVEAASRLLTEPGFAAAAGAVRAEIAAMPDADAVLRDLTR